MKFTLLDRIVEFSPRERITALKTVSLAEEYLADHFPTFPVLPGVLMLQALVEAGSWIVREAEGFTADPILLREAKNVTYKSFVKPGQTLRLEVSCARVDASGGEFSGIGYCEEREAVRARFTLARHVLERSAAGAEAAARSEQARLAFDRLRQPT